MPHALRRAGERRAGLHAPTVRRSYGGAWQTRCAHSSSPEHGGADVLEVAGAARDPEPGRGPAARRGRGVGRQLHRRLPARGHLPDVATPFVLGGSAPAGSPRSAPDVTDFAVGDVVATAERTGHARRRSRSSRRRPGGAGADGRRRRDVAAAAMLQGMTAHYLVNSTYAVHAGRRGARARRGRRGRAAARPDGQGQGRAGDRHGRQRGEGRDRAGRRRRRRCIRYDEIDDLAAAVRDARAGRRARRLRRRRPGDLRGLAGARCAPRGMLALFGAASGQVPPFDLQRLNPAGSLFVTRPTLGALHRRPATSCWRAPATCSARSPTARCAIAIGGRYALDEAAQAYRDLEGRAHHRQAAASSRRAPSAAAHAGGELGG